MRPELVIIAAVVVLVLGAHLGVFLFLRRMSRKPPPPKPADGPPTEPRP